MAGATPSEAVYNFVDPLQHAASCVTRAVLRYQGQYRPDTQYGLILGDGDPIRLKREDVAASPVYLSFSMWYRVVEVPGDLGPWKVTIDGYEYGLDDDRGREIIAYHWHPNHGWAQFPHLHIEAGCDVGRKEIIGIHLPTERIAFEDVLWVALHELKVVSSRPDWEKVLDEARTRFHGYRTWPAPGSSPDTD